MFKHQLALIPESRLASLVYPTLQLSGEARYDSAYIHIDYDIDLARAFSVAYDDGQ